MTTTTSTFIDSPFGYLTSCAGDNGVRRNVHKARRRSLETEYAKAYLAWWKQAADESEDSNPYAGRLKTGLSQQAFKQGENPVSDPVHVLIELIELPQDLDLLGGDLKIPSEVLLHFSKAAPVVKSERHEDESAEITTKTKIKRQRESSFSSTAPTRRRKYDENVVNYVPQGSIHIEHNRLEYCAEDEKRTVG